MVFKSYNYKDTGKDLTNIPANIHLITEVSTDVLYYVKSGEETKLYKFVLSTETESLIATRTKAIARTKYDRTNGYIYYVDSDYDRTTSFVWYLDTSDDSIVEVDSAPDNIYDIFLIGTDVYMIYFSSSYAIEIETIRPDGDVSIEWDNTGGGANFEDINEATNGDGNWIKSDGVDETDLYTMTTADLSGYDSGKITQIKIYCYVKTDNVMVAVFLKVKGNKTGTTTYKSQGFTVTEYLWISYTFSNLNLVQADLNDFEIYLFKDGAGNCFVETMYALVTVEGDVQAELYIKNITDSTSVSQSMGAVADRSYDMGQVVVVGTDVYFNWKWSNEDVELWKYSSTGSTITQKLSSQTDFGSDTNIPPQAQWALTYDNSNIISMVIGDGKEEISTYVSQSDINVSNGEYITFQGIDEDGNIIAYYGWFDKVGNGSGDPASANKTGIIFDISAGGLGSQAVSDIIQTAINSTRYFAAGNAGGASATVTFQNVYNGNVDASADVDTGWAIATSTAGTDNTYYFHIYSVSGDTFTKKGEYDIALMLDRNTNTGNDPPFNLEKAFHISEDKIYQIGKERGALNLISIFNFTGVIRAITDNFVIDVPGNIYQLVDQIAEKNIVRFEVTHDKEDYPTAEVMLRKDKIAIADDLFMQLIGSYSADNTTLNSQVVFEGIVDDFDEMNIQAVFVINQGREMDTFKPTGSKSGRTDQIIDDIYD
ncbi:hypothetical protein LCGC14_1446350, partial [marine sediment metagenome]